MRGILAFGVAFVAAFVLVSVSLSIAQQVVTPEEAAGRALDWVCAPGNRTWIVSGLAFGIVHGGASVVSALLKKFGITKDTPVIGFIVPYVRFFAIDPKPAEKVILAQAAQIQAAQGTGNGGARP